MKCYNCDDKRVQGDKTYFLLSSFVNRRIERNWIEKQELKKLLKSKKIDVYNLQIDKADRIVDRNPADCNIAVRHREIIAKHMEQLYLKFKKFGSDIKYKGEFYRDLKETGFIVGYMLNIIYNNQKFQVVLNFAPEDGYYVFLGTNDGSYEDILESEPSIENAMRFIENAIKEGLGLNLHDATSASIGNSNFKTYLGCFETDSSGQYIRPTILYVGGYSRTIMEFTKDIEDKAFFGGFVEGINDCCAIKLNSTKGMMSAILNVSKRYGCRVSVRGESNYSRAYLKELNNFYNKKACAIRSDGVLKLN